MSSPEQTNPSRPGAAVALGTLAGLAVALIALAFLWPIATAQARDLPVGVVAAQMPSAEGLPVEVTPLESRAAAVRAIEERDVYGALVLSADGVEALVAGANGPAPAEMIEGIGGRLAAAQQLQLTTSDIVPLSADDPQGAGIAAIGFPLVIGGIAGGAAISLLLAGTARRLLGLAAYAAASGLLVALAAGPMLGILGGRFWLGALVIGVATLATAATVVGLTALIGPPGIGAGAVLMLLLANPISGATLPYQFIAGPWGEVGQYLAPGAASTLLREVAYFADAATGREWAVLLAWCAAGITLTAIGHARSATLEESESPRGLADRSA